MTGRLPESKTQVTDRGKRVKIFYRGRQVDAFEGDTVASALLASGIDTFSRSFKYHRRRAPSCLSGQCSRCTMSVDGRMHVKTCQTSVREGMAVEPQGSVEFDPKALAGSFSWAMPTGFYYKMFYKPQWLWKRVKEVFRAMPGNMATVKPLAKKPEFDAVNLNPEMLVVGGGLAGIEAAITAAQTGIRVVLAEADAWLGGFEAFQGEAGYRRAQESIRRLLAHSNVRVLTSTWVSAIYPDGLTICVQSCGGDGKQGVLERVYHVRAGTTVVATGAGSMPMLFENNDRPGIILPEAAQRLIHLWGIKPGSLILLAGGDDYLYRVGLELMDKGIKLAGLVDYRRSGGDEALRTRLSDKGVRIWSGYTLTGSRGRTRVNGATLAKPDGSDVQDVPCDTIVASSGRYPRHKLLGQAGARMTYDSGRNFYLPENIPPAYQAAGRLLGLEDPEAIKAQARTAAARALKSLGIEIGATEPEAGQAFEGSSPAWTVSAQPLSTEDEKKSKTFVCYCHDVSEKNVEQAIEEGFGDIETCKRYTTATQGACQGGMCEANFAHLLARKRPELGSRVLPTTRPPVSSMSMGSMAFGHHDNPQRSPLHHVQLAHGGKPMRLGSWIRMMDFGNEEAESLAVHHAAGICDVSMLGKFRVFGPDAKRLLNRIMTREVGSLTGNKILYSSSCNEEGVLLDDGVILKMGDDDYFVTTLAGRAPLTEEWFSRWCREEDWQVNIVNLTETRAGMNLAGPKSREILSKLTDADLSNEALPFLTWARMKVAGIDVIAMRMGFVGELSYELLCPSSQAGYLWSRILEAGKPLGLVPFGIECLNICRLEKGHAVPGLDTDGFTNLFESSFGWMLNRNKTETVGKPMLQLFSDRPLKEQLIAFSLEGRSPVLDGALVVKGPRQLGRVTSIRYSPLLDKTIGLALVEPDEDWREGGKVRLWIEEGREVEAAFAKPPFYDPSGERMKA
ncbi:MAG: 2Fe-2S iron-sulfur cluster-binding protein [Burkholderiaceae bacterium]|jgi:sarcosine oxidase subunit alpha|nr:2Fe-2S iron-sulfur cluster-binding protein [Burkholderiaceae bacterium]